jgi:uncharacterized protein YndB with AHSA1/START domain
MLKIESTTLFSRPIEEVFAVLSNLENNPKWSSAFLEVKKTSQGSIGVGTTWRAIQRAFGRGLESEVEVTEYEPNRKWTQKGKSPFPVQVQATFESIDDSTRVNLRLQGNQAAFSNWRSRSSRAWSKEGWKPTSLP